MIDKQQIISWLEGSNLQTDEVVSDQTDWIVTADHKEIPVLIMKIKEEDRLVIRRQFAMTEDQIAILAAWPEEVRENFIFDIKRDLLLKGGRYNMGFAEGDGTILETLIVESYIYEDGITQDRFYQRFYVLIDSSLLFLILMRKYKLITV